MGGASDTRAPIDVAVAVILRADGSFLMAQRPAGKPYAGYWEFPGGKVEPGETVADALSREIREELGLTVVRAYPWVTQVFTYPHATVKLHFFRVVDWQGEPHPHEGQTLSWERGARPEVAPILPANGPILRGLSLPCVMGVSNAGELGDAQFLERMTSALRQGLRLVQIREKTYAEPTLLELALRSADIAHACGALVFLNGLPETAIAAGMDGVHLTAQALMQAAQKPDAAWSGASCHGAEELAHAAALGLDYVVLGPVLPTASHPGAPVLGWAGLQRLIRDYPLPVYAIGGLAPADLEAAWANGAHGIAMLRAAW